MKTSTEATAAFDKSTLQKHRARSRGLAYAAKENCWAPLPELLKTHFFPYLSQKRVVAAWGILTVGHHEAGGRNRLCKCRTSLNPEELFTSNILGSNETLSTKLRRY